MEIFISICSLAVAGIASLFAWRSTKAANRAIEQADQLSLFDFIRDGNQILVTNPRYLHDVHGLDESIPEAEAQNIAYLALWVNIYQQYYGRVYSGNYRVIVDQVRAMPTSLSTLLARDENGRRWTIIKTLFGEESRKFVDAIDEIIALENNRTSAT